MKMFDFISPVVQWFVDLIGRSGYPGIFLSSFLDRATIFLVPAEIIIPIFGLLIAQGKFSFASVFILVTLGNLLGNFFLYWISFKGGRPILEKYGKYFLISKHDLEHSEKIFSKYGDKIILIGYFLPTVFRSLAPIPAGIFRMDRNKFLLYTFFGSMPLNFIYIFVGIKAGENWDLLLSYFEKLNSVIIVVLVLLVIWYIYRHLKGRHIAHE